MNQEHPILKVKDPEDIKKLAATRHSKNVNKVHEETFSFGDRIADKMAGIAGSWRFIITFLTVLFLWIILNSIQLFFRTFDPFPFILLNLVLSCVAAIQAPVIMMSQNRQEEKDRIRSEHDYQVNLKAEILIEEIIKRLYKLEEKQQEVQNAQQRMVEILEKNQQ